MQRNQKTKLIKELVIFLVCRDFLFLSHSATMDHIIEYLLCHNINILKKILSHSGKNLHPTQISMVLHLIIQNRNVIKSHHLTNRVPLSQISAPPRLSKCVSVHQTSFPQY